MADVLVLGAGIVGTCTALTLQMRGHQVALIDRGQPGQETSFGNAAIIQSEAVEPYAMPLSPGALARIALGRSAEVRWTPRALWQQRRALAGYARASRPAAHARATAIYAPLVRQACNAYAPLIRDAGADHLIRREGYLELFRTQAALDQGALLAERVARDHDVTYRLLDSAALRATEPALLTDLPGAIHWRDPWTVTDTAALTTALAARFAERGGQMVTGDALDLRRQGQGWQAAGHQGEHAIIALGPWSPELTLRFGLRVPMLWKRGYHRHMRPERMPRHTLADLERGIVAAPMQAGLRICSGADLADHPAANPRQLRQGQAGIAELLGPLTPLQDRPWTARRPCMPDMLPVVGAMPGEAGLWANFGHGHHGLTLGAVTAGIIADQLEGAATHSDLSPERLTR